MATMTQVETGLSPYYHAKAPESKQTLRSVAVRVLEPREYKAAALTLAEAFQHDDVGRYCWDTPAHAGWTERQKWDLHLSILEYITYSHIIAGLATAAGEGYGCVALWGPPNSHLDTLSVTLRSGLWRLYYKLCAEGRRRLFTEMLPLLHHSKAAVLGARDDDSHYLVYIGTRPASRGQGLARAVLNDTLTRADKEGRPIYLESSNVANVAFYERMGFRICKTIALKANANDVRLDCMVREASTVRVDKSRPTKEVAAARGERKARVEVKLVKSTLPLANHASVAGDVMVEKRSAIGMVEGLAVARI